ncbi:MAG: hypothetical protein QG657_4454 [Acidobacteriota bacterium]|nr:hypothetical protein [Acidobacteriota bacterium]
MGILNKLFGKRENAPEKKKEASLNLAFILLSEARLPETEEIVQAFRGFAAPGENLQARVDNSGKGASDQAITLHLNTGEELFVALMPVPVPKGEADDGVQFSLSSFENGWKLPPHCAHLLVAFHAAPDSKPIVRLSRFTSLLAAVTKASPAVGVYWGNAGATHDPEFFKLVASDQDVAQRVMLWSGISIAREKDGRLSLLSLGLKQLELPDLLLVVGKSSEEDAFEVMFNLLAYVAERGEALPEGDTVGRTADERLPIHYVDSPIDSKKKVWRVELP